MKYLIIPALAALSACAQLKATTDCQRAGMEVTAAQIGVAVAASSNSTAIAVAQLNLSTATALQARLCQL